jgi:transposase
MFGRLRDCRRTAARLDKLVANFLADVHLAAAVSHRL